jgi:glutamate/aspartate transport system substrate-binding protein
MPRMTTWCLLLVATACVGTVPAHADTIEKMTRTNKLVVGYRATSVPFSFKNANGVAEGYQIDLCTRIAERLKTRFKLPQLKVEYKEVTTQQRIAAVKSGEIDIECASTTITTDRMKEVDFSYATYITGIRFASKRKANLQGIADLKGKAVAAGKGTTAERLLKAGESIFGFSKIVSTASSPEAFKLVESDEVAAAFTDEPLLLTYISKTKAPADYSVTGKYLSVEPYGLMIRRDDAAFKAAVNTALAAILASGEAKTLHERWFDKGAIPMPMNRLTKETFAYPSTHPAFP